MLKLDKFGGKRFRDNWDRIEAEVNQNAPLDGIGIQCDVKPKGTQINQAFATTGDASSSSGDSSGSTVSLYGALNGQPAIYHLKQSSAPTAL